MENNNEQKIDGVELEDFIDIYDKEDEKKNNFLEDLTPDLSLEQVKDLQTPKEEKPEEKPEEKDGNDDTLLPPEPQEEKKPQGGNFDAAIKALVEKGVLLPFEGKENIEEYSSDELQELIESNIDDLSKRAAEDDMNSLSPETKALLQYEKSGGTDIKQMMMVIASAKNTYDFDISSKQGQRDIIRAYFQAKRVYKTNESLERELNRLEDAGELEEKAQEFKPMLEEMQVEEVNRRLRYQQEQKQKLMEQMELYNNSIRNTLSQADINGVNMPSKTKNMIYSGLTTNNYQLISGRKSNLLYHLLEKKQFVEPDHALIAEVTWLLSDPEGYKNAVRDSVRNKLANETAEKIKSEQQGKSSSQQMGERRTLKRPVKNFFE